MRSDMGIDLFRLEAAQARALDHTCRQLGVRLLVLFGSHAPDGLTPGPESDLDLAVSFRHGAERPAFLAVHEEFGRVFPEHSPDVVFLGDADPLFRWEIMRAGVLLFGDVDDFLEFRAYAYRDFVDSADLRSLEHSLWKRKMNWISEQAFLTRDSGQS